MALAAQKFVSLTTYKKNGDALATPMWVGRDGDHLFVWTPADSAKIKRVRNDPRVTLVPCGRFGKPNNDAEPVAGTAEVITEPATVRRLAEVVRHKYGLEYWVVTLIERLAARGEKPRAILRIALSH
ncbi:MAG: PPOX class F420-dependent oxidoreductase [Mycobacterium sp.]|uniref:PPOX class F420-dependent oxidoreductase n=1 Tax=Mycobacterium sp. TaxID=1785 RepID=UPI003C75DAEB